MIIFGATGPVDAHLRRPWIDWIHTAKDQGAMIRDYTKWDDQPASPQAAVESVLRANQITRTAPLRAGVYLPRCRSAGGGAHRGDRHSRCRAFRAGADTGGARGIDCASLESDRASEVSIDSGRTRFAQARRLGSARALCRSDRRRGVDQQQRSVGISDYPSAALSPPPCVRPNKAATALIEKADLIISLDWLDLAGVLRLSLGKCADPGAGGENNRSLLRR